MDQAGIKLIFDAETKRAEEGAKAISDALNGVGKHANAAIADLSKIEKLLGEVAQSTRVTMHAITSMSHAFTDSGKKAVSGMGNVKRGVADASTSLTGFTRIIQDAPFGFIAVGNNISELITQLGGLSKQAGSAGGALRALGQSILGPGGVVLGLNLAISAVTVAVQKYGSLGEAVDAILNPMKEQARIQKAVNDTMLAGAQDAQTELAKIDALYRATQNLNVPLAERNKLIDSLQKKYPDYFKNFTNEALLAGQGAAAYDKLRQSIIATAQARAIEKKIGELSAQRLEIDMKRTKQIAKLAEAQANARKIDEEAAKAPKGGIGIGAAQQMDRFQAAGLSAAATVNSLQGNISGLNKEEQELVKTIDELIKRQDALAVQFGSKIFGIQADKAKAAGKTISDVVQEMNKDLTGLNVAFAAVGGTVASLAVDKLRVFEKALKDLAEFGVRPGDELFNQIKTQIEQLQNSLTKTPVTIKLPVKIEALPTIGFNNEAFRAGIATLGNNLSKEITALNERLTIMAREATMNAFLALGDGIGAAIIGSQSGIKAAMSSFLNILGGYMQALGKELIVYSKVLDGIKIAISGLNSTVALAAGAAAIIAGGALKAYAAQIPSFATGGIVYGDQIARVGDNPGRKEAIVPSEDWREAFGGMRGFDGELVTKVRGQDLFIIMKKAASQQGRVN
ncbi:coiled-coil domain-containing protein [Chitinophaga rhizosphaerae]|uniref:hypothetical protein n=1 Tax=Chitinophaga rhizosphaerae TaxID=1864947 RepID=UPI000F7FABFB|nr:hypothetical protein [Chitinophaga rhizosphaerae]